MKTKILKSIFITAALAFAACGGNKEHENKSDTDEQEHLRYDESLKGKLDVFGKLPAEAISETNGLNPAKIALGHKLYFDKQLSKDGNISCNSCHNLESYGVDNLPNSPGDAGKNGDRNSPTVLNASLHSAQFWDGRAKDVEEQAGMPVLNPIEMAIPNKQFLVDRLSKIAEYKKMFNDAFPGENNSISYDNIQKAIAAFERKLITPSRFDQYLAGESKALTVLEKKGLASFISIGCTSCHAGNTLGGNKFQKFGVFGNYWDYTKSTKIDEGKYNVTKQETDKYIFKVPSLRNIEKTHPYFHDGSIKELGSAVEIMAKSQLNYELNKDEKENIVAFLKTLTGDIPATYKKAP